MNLFDYIFGRRRATKKAETFFKMLSPYTPTFTTWRGSIYESDLVRASIHAIASQASKLNVKIEGTAKPYLQTLLKLAPNEFQTWSQFLYRLFTILEVNNTAYIVPVIDDTDRTTGIYAIVPDRAEFVQSGGIPYLRYTFADGQRASIELDRCGILTKFQYKSDFTGELNGALDKTMQLIEIQNQGIKEGVKSAATYRFMAQLSNFAFDEDVKEERKRFNKMNFSREAESENGMLLFPSTYKDIKQIDSKPFVVDAAQMNIIQTNVFNYFGVNQKILQNSANADELDAFYNGCIEPLAIQLAEVLTKMLFTLTEQSYGTHVYVAADRLQYMNVQSKINLATSMGDRGILTINEIRDLLNYAPIEDGNRAPIRGEYKFVGDEKGDKDAE